jgi:DNA primase large subunit
MYEYICPHCETALKDIKKDLILCPKCKRIMERRKIEKALCACGSNKYTERVDLRKIVDVDTVLISVRHMYRMPYSLHEKTRLVSMPFNINHILKFEKDEATPANFKAYKFLDRTDVKTGEASELFQKAFDFTAHRDTKKVYENDNINKKRYAELDLENAEAIPEEHFPPCIKKISAGLEDGKKRALLILINFLSACNWPSDKIEEYALKWNEKNYPDKLRDTYIKGQLRYQKSQKEKLLPPNCDNKGYMVDTQFCAPDEFCKRIKNPVQYAKKKIYFANSAKPKRRKKEENTEKV